MEKVDIHAGLEKSQIRDFLAQTLRDALSKNIQKTAVLFIPEDPLQYSIDQANSEIQFWQNQLKQSQAIKSIVQLIKMNGWDEHDVSDFTPLEPNEKYHISFIGTNSEYESLMIKLRNKVD